MFHTIVRKYKDNLEGKRNDEAAFVTTFGAMENKSLLYRLDRLILTSGVKAYLGFLNGEIFLFAVFSVVL